MNFILIYGPPAVGKLTIAEKLGKITGYNVFHNHLTIDLVNSFFKYGSPEHKRLVHKFRVNLIEAAAGSDMPGLIFTFCYAYPQDTKFVYLLKRKVESKGAKFHLVQLTCKEELLFKRVKTASRENFAKIKQESSLKKVLQEYDLFTPVPKLKSLRIDNSNKSVRTVAEKIKAHYKL